MLFYMIRDKKTGLWYSRQPPHTGGWTTQDKAAVWTTKGGARATMNRIRLKSSGELGYRTHRDCEPEIVTLPTTGELPDPIQVLRDLFEAGDLEDHFYAIREREGLGWEGPRMLKWGAACDAARKLMGK